MELEHAGTGCHDSRLGIIAKPFEKFGVDFAFVNIAAGARSSRRGPARPTVCFRSSYLGDIHFELTGGSQKTRYPAFRNILFESNRVTFSDFCLLLPDDLSTNVTKSVGNENRWRTTTCP